MKNLLLLLILLNVASNACAQSFSTDKFPKFTDYYERIDLYDENGNSIVSVAPKFYKNDATISIVEKNQQFSFKPRIKLGNFNVLECRDSEGLLVSTTSFNSDRKLTYLNLKGQDPNLLLMSLCTHKFQELLLGGRGTLSSVNNRILLGITSL